MTPTKPVTTVLWDIDGTLLHAGGVAAHAFLDAVAEVTGTRPTPERRDYGGRLDTEIADMLLTAVGAPTTLIADVLACLRVWSTSGSASSGRTPPLVPASRHWSASWRRRVSGRRSSPATWRPSPGTSSRPLGLVPPIETDFGGYGDSAPTRAAVARVALDRLSAAGWQPDLDGVWIVGDTRPATSPARVPSAYGARWWRPGEGPLGNWMASMRTSCSRTWLTRGLSSISGRSD